MHLYREVMCISPVRIRNPNLGNKSYLIQKLRDTTSEFINVPCGVCAECVAIKQMSIIQRVQMEELENHIFFCTLTYNDQAMPYVSTSNGHDIRYADISDVQKMIKRIRRHDLFGRKFRYFGVSELGSVNSRPHFHLLFFLPKLDSDDFNDCLNLESRLFNVVLSEWRRNLGSTRKPVWLPLCTYVRKFIRGRLNTTYDLHYVNPRTSDGGTADVAFYVTKYMIKPSDRAVRLRRALSLNLDPDEFNRIWSIVKPRWFSSLKFGYNDSQLVRDYVRKCIDDSKLYEDRPKFYSPATGSSFPLSRYYLNQGDFYKVEDAVFFNNKSSSLDNVVIDDRDLASKMTVIDKHSKLVSLIDSHDESYIFNELL